MNISGSVVSERTNQSNAFPRPVASTSSTIAATAPKTLAGVSLYIGITTAVRFSKEPGSGRGFGAKSKSQRKQAAALVNAIAIQEKLATKKNRSAHLRTVTPPTSTTLYISCAP